jgi:hypothetical protein
MATNEIDLSPNTVEFTRTETFRHRKYFGFFRISSEEVAIPINPATR